MDTNELKTNLQSSFDKLNALADHARTLRNQNLADIATSAAGKTKQLIDHPDLELMADTRKDQSVNPDGTPRTDRPAFLVDSATGKSLYESEHGPAGNWTALSQAERDQYDARARTAQTERANHNVAPGNPNTTYPGNPNAAPRQFNPGAGHPDQGAAPQSDTYGRAGY